ncbi:MAG TPA: hypothetical protein VF808_10015 [Ktedonobacterales bacterium]
MSRHTHNLHWRGTLNWLALRLSAPVMLALALGAMVAGAPAAHAAGASHTSHASCGAPDSGCGPPLCAPITPADYMLPATSPHGGARGSLSRSGGVTGSTVTFTGWRFPAGAVVQLLVDFNSAGGGLLWEDPQPFAQGVADASGRITMTNIKTPEIGECLQKDEQTPGDNPALFIAQTPDAQSRVTLLFTYHPAPSLQAFAQPIVGSGDVVFVTGAGWEPGQTVTITPAIGLWPRDNYLTADPTAYTSLPLAAQSVKAIYNGSFSVTLMIPPEPPETQIAFFATASGPRNGDVWVTLRPVFTVRPVESSIMLLSVTSGAPGGAVTVRGANWPEGQAVRIEYCRGQDETLCAPGSAQTLADIYTDGEGRIAATVQLPANAQPGPITIEARLMYSPFDDSVYARAQAYDLIFPFSQAHPRMYMALNFSPLVAAGLVIALLALGEARRRRRSAAVA